MKVQLIDRGFIEIPCETETEAEALWQKQKGVDPNTGQGWLTPQMSRNAQDLIWRWNAEQSGKR